MNARQLLSKFHGVKKLPTSDMDRWLAHCPAHEDNKQSLQIAQGDKAVLFKCHAGCETQQILERVGLGVKDVFADSPAPQGDKPKGQGVYTGQQEWGIVASYDYRDVDGTLLYQVVRKANKEFRQRRPDGAGGWIWKVAKQVKRVPYRLPELLARPTVFVVEGEKDADRLWTMDIAATCNAGGAGKWGASESKALAKACVERVVIIPDNDEPGSKHAHDVAAKCKKAGLAVSVIALPNLPHHGDVSDWLNAGGTRDGLLALASVPYVLPPAKGATPVPAGYSGPVLGDVSVAPGAVSGAAGAVELGPEPTEPDSLPNPTGYAQHGDGNPRDVGAGEAFRDRYGDRVRYDHHRDQWFVWNGNYWRPDETGDVRQLAIQHVRKWGKEVAKAHNYTHRDSLLGFIAKLERKQGIENMLTCATWLDPISTDGRQWNRNPWLFAARNGVIDLRTATLTEGTREHYITQATDIDYDPDAKAPRWKQFLNEVFDGDHSLITYVTRAVGYSMTADMREQIFFMCVGGGMNGKSIFLDTLEHVFGDYAHRANMLVFTGDAAKFHLAEMENRRLVVASENKQNTRLNEQVIKDFTGGESQSAERKGSQPFTFKPVGKIWMGVNHEPKVADDSYGFWRRVRLIPFLRTFTKDNADLMLRDKLRDEAPGILRWCVEGCDDWREFGLPTPDRVLSATDHYQKQENPLAEFFAERCQIDPESTTTQSAIIAAYATWCDDQGIRAYDRVPRRTIIQQLEKQFVIVNLAGINRVKGIKIIGGGLF